MEKLSFGLSSDELKVHREIEKERGVCACWESKSSCGSTGESQKLNKVWVFFLKGNKVAKGVCNVAKLATLHLHFSNYGLGHRSNIKYVLR